MPKIKEKFVKIARTCVLYLSYLCLGMCVAVPGPTLIDLQHAVKTDTKHIAFIYSSRSTGYLLGSLFGGIVFDFIKSKQILLIVCNVFMSLSTLATPWSPNLGTLVAAMAGGGIAMGALDTGSNVWLLNIWGKESAPFLQALHFAFGFGGFIGPLIAAPFLSERELDLSGNSTEPLLNTELSPTNNLTTNFTSSAIADDFSNDLIFHDQPIQYFNKTNLIYVNTEPDVATNLIYIYSIIGGLSFLVTFLFMILYCLTTKEENYVEEKKNENIKLPGKVFTCIVGVLIGIIIFIYAGIEIGYAQMLVTYAVKGNLKLPKATGSFMTSVFWGTFTFSRGLGILLSLYFKCLTLMIIDLLLTIIAGAILLVLGTSSETFLWIGTATLGIALASFFPSAISWVEQYIIMSNKIASIFSIGAALGEMVIPLLISQFIESYPVVLFHAVESSGILCAIMLFVLWLIVRKKGQKYISVTKNSKDNQTLEEDRF